MNREEVLAEAIKIAERCLNELDTRILPLDHQLFNTACDELVKRGDAMPQETRELLIAFAGVFIARQRMSDATLEMGDPLPPEAFGQIDRSNPH